MPSSIETSVSGNPFLEKDQVIICLDQIARGDDLKEKLRRTDWDLVVVDEAHKMSVHFWAGELEETKRYKLGKLLSSVARHFLLMTATPHNGKETAQVLVIISVEIFKRSLSRWEISLE